MTLTDREKALVEAGWLFLAEAQARECPKAKAKFEAALRAYDPPKPDPDVLVVRAVLHAFQRAYAPPDSGWGDMSYEKGSYDDLDTFKAALAAYRAIKATAKGSE